MQAFKDEEGLLRIRTKLVDSDEKEDFKFPVLLPANDVVVKLIREEHKKAMHADGVGNLTHHMLYFVILFADMRSDDGMTSLSSHAPMRKKKSVI
ncbi:hypothetical protein NPIL_249601 [Nephila pilipes]|uniref:Uncharacterized protein n=1 Tax=Nephila pilipes TaxID=299642 RepID=A0A8X6SY10_NEPPI|nr:hypothetical protein NPIL_249601 [Nephila pilipes]